METVNAATPYRPHPAVRGLVVGVGYDQRGGPPGLHAGLPSCALTFVIPLASRLEPGQALINPAGVWHTADSGPGGLVVTITPGQGTEHRPR